MTLDLLSSYLDNVLPIGLTMLEGKNNWLFIQFKRSVIKDESVPFYLIDKLIDIPYICIKDDKYLGSKTPQKIKSLVAIYNLRNAHKHHEHRADIQRDDEMGLASYMNSNGCIEYYLYRSTAIEHLGNLWEVVSNYYQWPKLEK